MTIRNLTVKQIATVLGSTAQDTYGLLKVLQSLGVVKQIGSIKADPTKRGRGEHLYQFTVETPTAVALKLDSLLDAATQQMSDNNVMPALVVEGPAPVSAPETVEVAGMLVEIPGEISVKSELDAPALLADEPKTLPGLGPVQL